MDRGNYLVMYIEFKFFNLLILAFRWFAFGSLVSVLIAIVPLFHGYIPIFRESKNTLSALNYSVTWALLIISGFFFTLGSAAFARAFEYPPPAPLMTWKNFETDELLAAWLFLAGE